MLRRLSFLLYSVFCILTSTSLADEPPAARPLPLNYPALTLQAFGGDKDALPKLREGEIAAVRTLERTFEQRYAMTPALAETFYNDLKSDDKQKQIRALNGLSLLPPDYHAWLREKLQKDTDNDRKALLRQALDRSLAADAMEPSLLDLLQQLYIDHIDTMFEATWGRLKEDPFHKEALYLFALLPFETAWEQLDKMDRQDKLRYLLLRVYTGSDIHTKRELKQYTAKEIHDLALDTYWPIMIEPLQVDGYFSFFTLVSSVNEKVATRVLRVACNIKPDKPWKSAAWIEIKTWFRWSYLFEIRPAQNRRDAVVYAEEFPQMVNHLVWPEDASLHFWIRHSTIHLPQVEVRAVRGFPLDALLPIYALTPEELEKWQAGQVYDWSRELFPSEVRDSIKFLPNAFPPPPKLPSDW